MPQEKRYLVDVGLKGFPFPMRVLSKQDPDGQATVARISCHARINHEFEARWIDRFIRTLHEHRDTIGTRTLRDNIRDYVAQMDAASVKIDFEYPVFIAKETPVSHQRCLIAYDCCYSVKVTSSNGQPKVVFRMDIPAITTDPASDPDLEGGLFGQLSVVTIEVRSARDLYPEYLVSLVDRHALSPIYSFLTRDDQIQVIRNIHSGRKSSVVMTDEIKEDLAANPDIDWYAVSCANNGMLHSYSTVVATEQNILTPAGAFEDDSI